jgi:ABC-type dipeptide/oligopeptide/nickel transport system permease subunit
MTMRGVQQTLTIIFVLATLAITIGATIGSLAGYFGKWVDAVLMRLTDMMLAFPRQVLLIVVIALIEPSIFLVVTVLGLTGWMSVARIVRGEVLSLREREFVQAARVLGMPTHRILVKELLPNLAAPIVVAVSLMLPAFVAIEAGLAFLGIGVTSGASWGRTIDNAVPFFDSYPLYLYEPMIGITLLVLSLNLLGDAIRDAMDPKTRR